MKLSVAATRPAFADVRSIDLLPVRVFAAGLAALLLGYMFLGRGFAHIGIGPIYIGDVVLIAGVAVAGWEMIRGRARIRVTPIVGLLLAFIVLGIIRTVPYLGSHGTDALRDGVIWGYAGFALIVIALFDRRSLSTGLRLYGWIVPLFAFWLPISWNIFAAESLGMDPSRPGSFVPLVFFKAGDMAVHMVGCIAALVLAAALWRGARTFAWRMLITFPLLWTLFVAGTHNRGALLTAFAGIVVVALIAGRTRNWLPLGAAALAFTIAVAIQASLPVSAPLSGATEAPPSSVAAATATAASPFAPPPLQAAIDPGAGGSVVATPQPAAAATPDASATSGSVPITNPGFEAPAVGGAVPGWTFFGVGRFTVAATGGHDGSAYGRIDATGGPYKARLNGDPFAVGAGPDIGVSVWASAIEGTPSLEVYVNWYDAAGNMTASQFVKGLSLTPGRGWQSCDGELTVPSGAVKAQLRFWEAHGTSVLGVDDVSVRFGDLAPKPVQPQGRQATIGQMVTNILSVFGLANDSGLAGSREFRLAWWGTIADYTAFGPYFWTGKGFGVNLADADGFQATADHSLRAPHNTHMTILAREGVPGFALWLALQTLFAVGLAGTILRARRAGDMGLVILGGFILVYWLAMMIDTSFDPFLEGPQGGIWFWTIFGAGIVLIQAGRSRAPAP